MARPAALSLLEAALRTQVPEDRTSEILAYTLAHDPAARRALCDLARATWHNERTVVTQRRVTKADRIDIELTMFADGTVHVIWIEVKEWAAEQPEQLIRYARELGRLYPECSTLVALARANDHSILASAAKPFLAADDGEVAGERTATVITWQDLGASLDGVGRDRDPFGRRTWRRYARDRAVPVEQRDLKDLLDYLERRGLVEPETRITSADVSVAARAESVLSAIERLLDRTTAVLPRFKDQQIKRYHGMSYDNRNVPATGWPAELNAGSTTWLGLEFSNVDDGAVADALGEPVITVSYVFDQATPEAAEALRDKRWPLPEEVSVYTWQTPRYMSVFTVVMYLSELASTGPTFSEQVEALVKATRDGIARLEGLPDPRSSGRSSEGPTDPMGTGVRSDE